MFDGIDFVFSNDPFCRLSAEEVLERADYLYSCGETEKLYQLLAQHQNRWGFLQSRGKSVTQHLRATITKTICF